MAPEILIESSIYDDFKKKFVEEASKLKVGDPFDEKSDLGALVSEAHVEKVQSYIELAERRRGVLYCWEVIDCLMMAITWNLPSSKAWMKNAGPTRRRSLDR